MPMRPDDDSDEPPPDRPLICPQCKTPYGEVTKPSGGVICGACGAPVPVILPVKTRF